MLPCDNFVFVNVTSTKLLYFVFYFPVLHFQSALSDHHSRSYWQQGLLSALYIR